MITFYIPSFPKGSKAESFHYSLFLVKICHGPNKEFQLAENLPSAANVPHPLCGVDGLL